MVPYCRVIFSVRLHTQEASIAMTNALTRLIIEASVFSPAGKIAQAIDPRRYYLRWRDERYDISYSILTLEF